MKRAGFVVACLALLCSSAELLLAQSSSPVRKVTAPVSSDSGMFTNLTSARPLPNGRVMVNDMVRRRLMIFDSTLAKPMIVADTAEGAPNKYPNTFAAAIPYLGDSTLLVDREAQLLQVLDASGKFVRAMALPQSRDLPPLSLSPGSAATDPLGRLVYRVYRFRAAIPRPDSGKMTAITYHDSSMIVRANFDSRTLDSIATHALPVEKRVMISAGGSSILTTAANPLPQTDEWAMLPDGTIAIVRGGDYHIDWVHPDGSRTSSPKMPFDWKRVTDEEKQRMLDSARETYESRQARTAAGGAGGPVAAGGAGGRGGAGGFGAVAVAQGAPPGAPGAGSGGFVLPKIPFTAVDKADLPDYYPPIRIGTVKADPEGRVWVLPTTSVLAAGGLTYDVVNRKGEIVERVQLPPGRSLLAVGPGGVVYMSNAAPGGARLERARIIR